MEYTAAVSWKSPTTERDRIFDAEYVVDFSRFYAMREWRRVDQQPRELIQTLNRIADAINSIGPQADERFDLNPRALLEAELRLADASHEEE